MSLQVITRIYESLDSGRVRIHRVVDSPFLEFSARIGRLERRVPFEDLRGRQTLQWLKRFRYMRSVTPVSHSHPLQHCLPPAGSFKEWRRELELAYSDESELIGGLSTCLDALLADESAPLRATLESVLAERNTNQRIAVSTPESRYFSCFEPALMTSAAELHIEVELLSQRELRDLVWFDAVVLIGAANWYRQHLFAAPKAAQIEVVQYAWISADLPRPSIPSESSSPVRASDRRVTYVGVRAHVVGESFDAAEYRPALISHDPYVEGGDAVDDNTEECVLVHFETGEAVYLPDDPDTRVLTIDESSGVPELGELLVEDIEPGMHIVLRTEGGTDYLSEVADSILGEQALTLRADQHRWKRGLLNRVRFYGVDRVVRELKDRGLSWASRSNLSRWCSTRSIATRDEESFGILLAFIGLGEITAKLWNQAERIRAAHQSGGAKIRTMLLQVLRKSDLLHLRRFGRMDFRLDDIQGAGALTAFTVREVGAGAHAIASNKVGRPFGGES